MTIRQECENEIKIIKREITRMKPAGISVLIGMFQVYDKKINFYSHKSCIKLVGEYWSWKSKLMEEYNKFT
jgi:hypothetical protein